MLKEGEGDHGHERMPLKALPGSSFEVIKAEFLFQLLMTLFANPSRLDGGGGGANLAPVSPSSMTLAAACLTSSRKNQINQPKNAGHARIFRISMSAVTFSLRDTTSPCIAINR